MRGAINRSGGKYRPAANLFCALSLIGGLGLLTGCQQPSRQAQVESAAAAGNPTAQFVIAAQKIAEASANNQDAGPAIQQMTALANKGIVPAQVFMGELNLFPPKGMERDGEAARIWLQKAADQKSPTALADLTYIYGRGFGVKADGAKAYGYAKSVADTGDADGQVALGHCYSEGWGVPKNQTTAMIWYRKAADQREPVGFIAVGKTYRDGAGTDRDNVMAFAWFSLANQYARYANEKRNAAEARDDLGVVMLPDEIRQGNALANQWQPGRDLVAERLALKQGGAPTPVVSSNTQDTNFVTGSTTPRSRAGLMQESDIAVRDLHDDLTYVFNPDGTYTQTYHVERKILKEAAVQEAGQMPFAFNNTIDQLEIVEAHTLKADGSKLPVSPSAIYEQPAPGSPTAPTFNDQRVKVVVFPNVAAGDTLVATSKITSKPLLPGYFSASYYFERVFAMDDLHVTITAPRDKPLVTDTHDMDFKTTNRGDTTVYEWRYRNPRPVVEDLYALDPYDRLPRFFVSSYQSYEQFAKIYTEAVEGKTIVTPKLQKLADDITTGTTDRRKQASLLHDWVSRNIRYVAVMFGHDAIIPHDATAVYEAGYGDCKDHSALLVTLLKAKGIESQITLINYGASYSLPQAPSLGTLNHAITYIPEFNLFTDTTAGTTPFGVLTFGEYGKPVIIAAKSGQIIRQTPSLKTADATVNVVTKAKLKADGTMTGETNIEATGPFASDLRQSARSIQAGGPEQMAKQFLQQTNAKGSGTFNVVSPEGNSSSYALSGTFTSAAHPEYISGASFEMPLGLNFLVRPGQTLLGPITMYELDNSEPTACYGGKVVEEISLTLPAGKQLRALPKPFTINNELLQYSSTWTNKGGTVINRREFVSHADQPVCIGKTRQIAAEALNDIRGNEVVTIALAN